MRAFETSGVTFSQTVIVVSEGDPYIGEVIDAWQGEKPEMVIGGASRTESVRSGLAALSGNPPDYVLIHDAARPLVTSKIIRDVVGALQNHQAAVPVLPIADAVKAFENNELGQDVDRATIRQVQTPQGFRYADIMQAFDNLSEGEALPDDIAAARTVGLSICAVDGDRSNIKITFPEDMKMAEAFMRSMTYVATGSGFDVHRFEPGDSLWLCGIEIPADISLKGHSDADVGLHALTDAILGALADGDIGDHFPPSEPQWKGAPSERFLTFARDKVRGRGGSITHVDVTLICERPKVKPYRAAMKSRIAELLELPESRVSVKATTTEKLGFTGREEGIAAQATATVSLPVDS